MKENKVGFRLLKISTEQFAIIESAFVVTEKIQLGAGIEFGVDDKSKVVACGVRFELNCKSSPFLIIHVRCDFGVDEDAWSEFYCKEKQSICFPRGFACHLAVLTVGTARGVLHTKTENTKFNEYFLPTINVNDLVKEDVEIVFNKI